MSDLLGLRGRLTAAMVGIGVLALAVTAVLLLTPLDRQLRRDALTSLRGDAREATATFAGLPRRALHPGSARLDRAVRELRRRTGAEVAVFDRRGRRLAVTDRDADRFPEVARALRVRRMVSRLAVGDGRLQAQVALPIEHRTRPIVLDMRRSLEALDDARSVVDRSLVAAALVALCVALVAGLGLAGRLARRITALRDSALRLADAEPGATTLADDGRDEVADLTRAFATMQRRLQDQEQARRTFVSTASHELRTPLASLRLMLHAAEEELDGPEPEVAEAREQVGRALEQTLRLGRLAGELLDLSRIDAGLQLRADPVELRELADAVLSEFHVGDRGRTAAAQLDAVEPVWATADPSAGARIVRILLDNGLRHAGPGGQVTVAVGHRDGTASVAVHDSGPGVAAEDADRIFERFERGPGAAADGGFGLGLAIGRELARRMGGDLRLTAPGPGATFELTLPLAVAPPDA